jgi:uncharacterized damage-inducible protein DinB
MPNENEILARMFRHNVWANERMLAACGPLSAEQLATELEGTYGRLDRTLIHLARAQGGYVRQLTAWQPGPEHRLEYDEPFPGTDAIARHLAFTGERLVDVASSLPADRELTLEYDGEPQSLPAWVVLIQAAYHATEHRQQVATVLTTLGFEPPEPDLWAYWDELAAAGR